MCEFALHSKSSVSFLYFFQYANFTLHIFYDKAIIFSNNYSNLHNKNVMSDGVK